MLTPFQVGSLPVTPRTMRRKLFHKMNLMHQTLFSNCKQHFFQTTYLFQPYQQQQHHIFNKQQTSQPHASVSTTSTANFQNQLFLQSTGTAPHPSNQLNYIVNKLKLCSYQPPHSNSSPNSSKSTAPHKPTHNHKSTATASHLTN
jgi:hypothetical protein